MLLSAACPRVPEASHSACRWPLLAIVSARSGRGAPFGCAYAGEPLAVADRVSARRRPGAAAVPAPAARRT
jgi:hypothetical protein